MVMAMVVVMAMEYCIKIYHLNSNLKDPLKRSISRLSNFTSALIPDAGEGVNGPETFKLVPLPSATVFATRPAAGGGGGGQV